VTRVTRLRGRRLIPLGLAVGLVLASVVPAGAADPYDRKRAVEQQLDQAQGELRQSTKALDDATRSFSDAQARLPAAEQALAEAEQALTVAQEQLARARGELAAAKAQDAAAAAKLAAAEQRVRDQEARIVEITARIEGKRAAMSELAVEAYQQGAMGRMLDLAAVFEAEDVNDFTARVTYAQSVLNAEDTVLTGMEDDRVDLANERVKLEELREEARRLREEAARHLQRTRELEAAATAARAAAEANAEQARAAKAAVDELVTQRSGAVAAAEHAKADDAKQYAALTAERDTIDGEIAELARKAREERARKAAAARAASASSAGSSGTGSSGASSSGRGSSSGGSSSGGSSDSGGLSYPVSNPYVTSPYGMRIHPVTGVYKLHDGTDFRAHCGTPIRAAAPGRVLWARYRGGYGNQVAVDHGVIGGDALMTSYSHLSRFSASRGEGVSRGEVIGYSGSTGYSTACHLHFMVYDDGVRANPMSYL
jgi:murein DD-endopeptidase MepM/ murein hydrolase activator NlpD